MDRNIKNDLKNCIRKNLKYYESHKNTDFHTFKMSVIFLFSTVLLRDSNEMLEVGKVCEYEHIYSNEFSFLSRYFINQNIFINLAIFEDKFVLDNVNFLINHIKENDNLNDEILAWTYQYFNEGDVDNKLSITQFFTEKYMTKYLIDKSLLSTDISEDRFQSLKVIDPACGGGNFLVYLLEVLFEKSLQLNIPHLTAVSTLLDNIYGYDLDNNLAMIASINLKIKALNLLRKIGEKAILDDIFNLETNVYCSTKKNLVGSLNKNYYSHCMMNVETKQLYSMLNIIDKNKYDYVFTNPPFQGIKGMLDDLKDYLKEYYPKAKCDLCNAFIERVLEITKENGVCGIVTQNSWMFLDSYDELRKDLLDKYSILDIVDLGSNSFHDLSGEKANVALVTFGKRNDENNITNIHRLKNISISEKNDMLNEMQINDSLTFLIKQSDFYLNKNYRLEYLSFGRIKESFNNLPLYGEFARPMQGTSTGDSSKFIDFHWKNESNDWVLVSKGGSYCKWNGLNIYKILWGTEGEYIKQQKGSALRNVKCFKDTFLVFSDTGTSGLSVRLLKENQIFVASGPGIRDLKGDKYAHIALLNSRLFSYYIRILSPKLTIAAGYISSIPTVENLLYLKEMSTIGKRCCELKDMYLKKRVVNYEFKHFDYEGIKDIDSYIKNSIIEDLWLELYRLENEYRLENIIMQAYEFSEEEIKHIYEEVGNCAYECRMNKPFDDTGVLDRFIYNSIDSNCDFKKTKSVKSYLGIEGILESLALEKGYHPVDALNYISENIDSLSLVKSKYMQDYFHKLVLYVAEFRISDNSLVRDIKFDSLINRITEINPELGNRKDYNLKTWIVNEFNRWHSNSFRNAPILKYDNDFEGVISLRQEVYV